MDLSIIVVCYKGWEKLIACLESLESFSGTDFSSEVIIVDNNSGDKNLEAIEKRFNKFKFIHNKVNGGYANGCNLGFTYSTGNFILILNPDTIVTEAAIGQLLDKGRKNKNYFISSCRQLRHDGTETRPWGKFPGLNKRDKSKSSISQGSLEDLNIIYPDWVSGSLMLISREVYNLLGGFDEDFWMYYEDVDICKRARDKGGEIALFRDICIEHNHGGSSRTNVRITSITKTEVQKSRHLYIHKHLKGFDRIFLQTIIVAENIITGLIACVDGLVFFFIPKLFVRVPIFFRLVRYYCTRMFTGSWVSSQSVNYKY